MPERAHPDDPIWCRKLGLFPTPALKYLVHRYAFCRPYANGKSVLDAPCGTGMGSVLLGKPRYLVGLDYSAEALSVAKEKYPGRYDRLDQGNLTNLPYPDSSFEMVICLEGIEHIHRHEGTAFLAEAHRVLSPNGILAVSCPIGAAAVHSGNEYHLYEWGLEELRTVISRAFEILKAQVIRGPAGDVQIIVARRRDAPAPAESEAQRLGGIHDRLAAWHDQARSDQGASYRIGGPPGFLQTCFSILLDEAQGTLPVPPDRRHDQLTAMIAGQQDPVTGSFGEHLVDPRDISWRSCDVTYVRRQVDYFAVSALTTLGQQPRHKLHFAEPYLDPKCAIAFLDGGPWHDPWNHSNRIMFLLRFLICLNEDNLNRSREIVRRILAYLDELQSADTGLWHGPAKAGDRDAVFAAYHFYPFYFWAGVRPRHIERAIDTTLGIQGRDGLFGKHVGGGACEDLDAIDVLVKLSYLTDHRLEQVKSSLMRAYHRIAQLQNSDGGFPNYAGRPRPLTWKRSLSRRLHLERFVCRPLHQVEWSCYSGWAKVGSFIGESDLWGAWFRLISLKLIAERVAELEAHCHRGRFHGLPALGWHNREAILALR